MARRLGQVRGIAHAEAAAIAGILLTALDRDRVDACDDDDSDFSDGGDGDGDVRIRMRMLHVREGDGALDCSELPIRAFDAVDAEGCADGHLTFEELEAAFLRLAPGVRRALGEDLRPLAIGHLHAKRRLRRAIPFVAIAFPLSAGLDTLDFDKAALALFVAAVLATAIALAAGWRGHRTRRAIARLVDEALA